MTPDPTTRTTAAARVLIEDDARVTAAVLTGEDTPDPEVLVKVLNGEGDEVLRLEGYTTALAAVLLDGWRALAALVADHDDFEGVPV